MKLEYGDPVQTIDGLQKDGYHVILIRGSLGWSCRIWNVRPDRDMRTPNGTFVSDECGSTCAEAVENAMRTAGIKGHHETPIS